MRLNPEVPASLELVIHKLLEKDRDLRYQSAADVRADMKRLTRDTESGKSVATAVAINPFGTGKYLVAGAVLLLLVAVASIWFWRSKSHGEQIESIAVIPFSNSGGNADTDLITDGLTESLIASLAHVPELKVKSRNSVFRYKGKDVDLQQVGKDLTVDALLTGRVVQYGDAILVNADLTNVRDNTEIWGEHYETKTTDVIALQERIAGDIASKLRAQLSGAERQQVTRQGTQNPEAYQLYVKGRYYWNKRTPNDLKAAISYFNQAIDKDPSYALAYSGLADTYDVLSYVDGDPNDLIPKAKAAAKKALELDPALARPHALLGLTKMGYDWDFSGGEAEFRKAFELDPSDATAHQWFAELLAYIGGREQESISEADRARQLDPLSLVIAFAQGETYTHNRQYENAITLDKKIIAENPTFANAHIGLAWAYWGEKKYLQYIQELRSYSELGGDKDYADYAAALDAGYRVGGWPAAARKGIDALVAQRKAKTNYLAPYVIAQLYADLGDKDHAFEWLNVAYQERNLWIPNMPTDYALDPLRSDPRYKELVRKVGFPE